MKYALVPAGIALLAVALTGCSPGEPSASSQSPSTTTTITSPPSPSRPVPEPSGSDEATLSATVSVCFGADKKRGATWMAVIVNGEDVPKGVQTYDELVALDIPFYWSTEGLKFYPTGSWGNYRDIEVGPGMLKIFTWKNSDWDEPATDIWEYGPIEQGATGYIGQVGAFGHMAGKMCKPVLQ